MERARQVLQRALQIAPKLARANYFYARVLRNDGDYEAAEQHLQTVLAQPAFKIFAAYRRPWWQERNLLSGRSVTDLPVRQCYYWFPEKDVRDRPGSRPTAGQLGKLRLKPDT